MESLCNDGTERRSMLPLRARFVLRSTHDAATVKNVASQLIDHCRRRVRRAIENEAKKETEACTIIESARAAAEFKTVRGWNSPDHT
jgi:hypothetical protein